MVLSLLVGGSATLSVTDMSQTPGGDVKSVCLKPTEHESFLRACAAISLHSPCNVELVSLAFFRPPPISAPSFNPLFFELRCVLVPSF
jgi:hypothetical protein